VIAALDRADRSPHAPAGPVVATRPVASAAGAAAAPAVAAGAPEEHLADVPLAAAHAGSAVVAATPAVAALTTPSSPVAGARAATRPPNTNMRGGYSLSRQLGLGIARIVIDPGHGGHDPGAKVRGLTEADLVLDVALRLEALLAAQPGVEVVLTRRTNTYVSLEDRTDIANRADADIFLSIHANASANTRATGIESYFLNFAPNKAAEAAAARENAASGRAMRHLGDIVKAIALDNKRDESRDLATMIQAALHGQARRDHRDLRNLGVKQAPFMVLIGATMPSVLTEIAFITNQQELALLKKDTYRQHLAEGLLAGITRYQQSLKRAPAVAQN
jgi:N-acetylmuramoyl-L-alanine amidase